MFDVALDHIDETSASLSSRARPQVANHIRSLQEQTLDALLRIEELLEKLVRAKALEDLAENDAPYNGEDITTVMRNIDPTKTPFMEALGAPVQKPKRSRK